MTITDDRMSRPRRAGFRRALRAWYAAKRRDLPWRAERDPYLIWISEVMLQQTQVAAVIPYYERFTARYPDVRALSAAPLEEVLKLWEGLGYYARARNLHRAAAIIAAGAAGEIPRDYTRLRSLPGIGDYIASAVMSIAYGEPYAAVDGNVKRVLARIFLVTAPATASSSAHVFKDRAAALLDRSHPGEFNQAMMELGATICVPRNPSCGRCPVAACCRALAEGCQKSYPVRVPRRPIPRRRIAVGVVRKDGRILITRRKESGLLGGLWEFPGGKIEPGESPEDACRREIAEEVNLSVEVTKFIARVDHSYSHFKVAVEVFDCEYKAGEIKLSGPTDFRWILVDEMDEYAFPAVNRKMFPYIERGKP